VSEPSPAFQFYPSDFIVDEAVASMTLAERGLYITLMCYCWREGSIPSNAEQIARLVREPLRSLKPLWDTVLLRFTSSPDEEERLIHERLEGERLKQTEFRERKSRAGSAGSVSRHGTQTDGRSLTLLGSCEAPVNTRGITEEHSSSSSSSSYTETTSPLSEIEEDVGDFLAVVASANKSGKMAETRAAGIRRDLVDRVKTLGVEAVRYGLREAVQREKPSVGYVVACAKNYKPSRHLSPVPAKQRRVKVWESKTGDMLECDEDKVPNGYMTFPPTHAGFSA
jgi:uncharacterized protein YdaU (DUF1376 family)